jgi:DNA invertase Pin-like site-specific DNA recombinase
LEDDADEDVVSQELLDAVERTATAGSRATRAGLARARAQGKRLGRPPLDEEIKAKVRRARARGDSVRTIARDLKIGVASVQRLS